LSHKPLQTKNDKLTKGLKALTAEELQKMAQLFNLTINQIINYDSIIPTEIVIEDKTALNK
jgi:hypothetical protein